MSVPRCHFCENPIIYTPRLESYIKRNPELSDYCSLKCAHEDGLDVGSPHRWTRRCARCSDIFITEDSYACYCSKKCSSLNVCLACGEPFIAKYNAQKYCSKECCKQKKDELREMCYFEVFTHDGFRCQYCGKTPQDGIQLVVDHVYPIAKGGEADRFNLITACSECNAHKTSKLLPLRTLVEMWDRNKYSYTYKDAKEYWKKDYMSRSR